MDKVIYVAMTGARENMYAQQIHANNLANATTTGFKTDMEQARSMRAFGEGHPSRVYSMSERPATDTTSGTLMETGRDLDVAINGSGWIAVQTGPDRERYTRGGELLIDSTNTLVTGSGLPVIGNGGAPIVFPEVEKITIANDGTISIRPLGSPADELVVIDQIKMVDPEPGVLWKGDDGLMRTDDEIPLPEAQASSLRAGYLESSNVNAVNELTSIISLSRQFEMQVKMMKTAEELSSAATQVLRLS